MCTICDWYSVAGVTGHGTSLWADPIVVLLY